MERNEKMSKLIYYYESSSKVDKFQFLNKIIIYVLSEIKENEIPYKTNVKFSILRVPFSLPNNAQTYTQTYQVLIPTQSKISTL